MMVYTRLKEKLCTSLQYLPCKYMFSVNVLQLWESELVHRPKKRDASAFHAAHLVAWGGRRFRQHTNLLCDYYRC
jgi:hypothetical protein